MGSVLYDLSLSVSQSFYQHFSESGWIVWSRDIIYNTRYIIDGIFIRPFPNIWISPPWLTIRLPLVINKTFFKDIFQFMFEYIDLNLLHSGPKYKIAISNNMWPYVFRYLFGFIHSMIFACVLGLYLVSSCVWLFTTYF